MAGLMRIFKRRNSKEGRANAEINSQMRSAQRMETERMASLLLLGAGDSGKSTVLKQIRIIHAGNISQDELMLHVDAVHTNIVESIKNIAQHSLIYESEGKDEFRIDELEVKNARDRLSRLELQAEFTPELANDIALFWGHDTASAIFGHRSEFHCMDTAPWFFEKIQEICGGNYCPSVEDFVRTRTPTTGINQEEVIIDVHSKDWTFKFTDVGGQRNERKKWIHVFDNVTALVWVAAMSEYDQGLYEDSRVNRMAECFELFANTVSLDTFAETDVIVFLNKSDLFLEKLETIPFTVFQPDFAEPHNPRAVKAWIKQQFTDRFRESGSDTRRISFYTTCATDTAILSGVMDQVMVNLTHARLQRIGMIG